VFVIADVACIYEIHCTLRLVTHIEVILKSHKATATTSVADASHSSPEKKEGGVPLPFSSPLYKSPTHSNTTNNTNNTNDDNDEDTIIEKIQTRLVAACSDLLLKNIPLVGSCLWAVNPAAIVICTRGSADSLTNYLVLHALRLALQRRATMAGLTLG
jgi:hypothetical protein